MSHRSDRTRGFSMVEVAFAMAMIGVALMVMLQQVAISHQEMRQEDEDLFAYQKAMAMLAEIQASVDSGKIDDAAGLDLLIDAEPVAVLTTRRDGAGQLLVPDHPMSGNVQLPNWEWKWVRQVQVAPMPESSHMRYVTVRVSRRDDRGGQHLAASLGGVMNLPVQGFPKVKEYDVYLLAIDSAPSLWKPLPELRALMESAASRIESSNPGLRLRLHWITKFGYGRDSQYVPFVNESTAADLAAPWVYWYPGKLAAGDSASQLFSSELFGGRVRTENGIKHDYDATENPFPHAVADQFNHCLRLPAARVLFERRVAAGLESADAPPLQILLEDMHSEPAKYRNAMVLNLHGEGLPYPPLRNYSDAAKVPDRLPGVRVVTHPERLRAARDPNGDGSHDDSEDVYLRVYAYKTDPDSGAAVLGEPVTVQIMGVDLTGNVNGANPATLTIENLEGGINLSTGQVLLGAAGAYSPLSPALRLDQSHASYQMHYEVGYSSTPEPHTWIRLHNMPVNCSASISGLYDGGIGPDYQLYGMEYIPSSRSGSGQFDVDLATVIGGEKNTARWRIRVPKTVLGNALVDRDQMLTIRTRIGASIATGQTWPGPNEPHNLSETYAWWASSPEFVPLTERFQVLGDPRHNPYVDLSSGGTSPHGYNRYFDDLRSSTADATGTWLCLDAAQLRDGFAAGVPADVPRIMQVWRQALQSSSAVFTNADGRLAGALLLGGEIALPRSGGSTGPSPVTLHGALYDEDGTLEFDTVTPGAGDDSDLIVFGRHLIEQDEGSFWAKGWLGELFPDSAYSGYGSNGNLACGSYGFKRKGRGDAEPDDLPRGTSFGYASGASLGDLGESTLPHGELLSIAEIQSVSLAPEAALIDADPTASSNLLLPTADGADLLAAVGLEPSSIPGLLPETVLVMKNPQVTHLADLSHNDSGLAGSRVLQVTSAGGASAFLALLTEMPESAGQHVELVERALVFGLGGYHEAGATSEIDQVPQLEVLGPLPGTRLDNPSSVELQWRTDFVRFDGESFGSRYPDPFAGDEMPLRYVVLYSKDGEPFRYADNGAEATPGVPPADSLLLLSDSSTGDESYWQPLPAADFPAGSYIFRLECFHGDRLLHASHHQVSVDIDR